MVMSRSGVPCLNTFPFQLPSLGALLLLKLLKIFLTSSAVIFFS